MTENKVKLCRLCMYEEKCADDENKMLNVFDDGLTEIQKKIRTCTQLQLTPNDTIPPNICKKCLGVIEEFYTFFEACQNTDKTLREVFNVNTICTQTSQDITPHSSNNLSNESTMCGPINDYDLIYRNQTYVTNIDYINKSVIPNKIDNYDNINDKISKTEDDILDEFIDESDSDTSSSAHDIKEHKNRKTVKFPEIIRSNSISCNSDSVIYSHLDEKKLKIFGMDESMKKVIDESLYACSICSKKFSSYFEYQDHQLSHDGELVFSCSKCNKVFCKRDELAEHNRNHKVHCNICNVKVLPDSLASHLQKHSDSRRCCNYNNGHTAKAAPEEYFKSRHAGTNGFVCDICGKRVNCESSMDRHMAYHHSARPYRCKFCNFSSKSISILSVHTSRMHETKRCVCELCFKWFKSELSLNQHMKRMHSPKKYICDVCGKGYMNKSNLKTHIMKKHTRETLYDCSTCGRDFFTMKELKEHMRIHKGGCLSCPKCGREFFYKKHLERHMLTCAPRDKHRKIACWRLKSSASLPNSSLGSFM